jgi:dynein heavy chain
VDNAHYVLVRNADGAISVDFVLRDPREKNEEKKEELPPHREELEVVPKPWEKSYYHARNLAIENLFVTNPCMLQVLQLWHASFE